MDGGMPASSAICRIDMPEATSDSIIGFHMGVDIRLAESKCQRLTEGLSSYRRRMTFGERVKEMRELRGLTRDALAKRARVAGSTITDIEDGTNQQSRKLAQIARALGANPLYLTDGILPKESEEIGISLAVYERDSGEISIPQLDVLGSMGTGAIPPDHIDVVRNVIVNRKELEKQCSFTAPQNLQIITGYGRSMKPTFSDGDPLLVDVGVTSVTIDAVYVFEIEGELFIKGLQRLPGGRLRVISHNREENDPWEINPFQMETLKIRGRVVMAWNARRL